MSPLKKMCTTEQEKNTGKQDPERNIERLLLTTMDLTSMDHTTKKTVEVD